MQFEYQRNDYTDGDKFIHIFWKNWGGMDDTAFTDALKWSWDHFGRNNVHHGGMSIRLREDDHAFAFRMRWC